MYKWGGLVRCVWGGRGVKTHACYFFVRKLNTVFEWEGKDNRVVLHEVHNCEIAKVLSDV
jgi:hypothetical protein